MAKFNPPEIQDNRNGWGPCDAPEQFKDLPYAPFSKGDRLGKVAIILLKSLFPSLALKHADLGETFWLSFLKKKLSFQIFAGSMIIEKNKDKLGL